MSKPSTIPAPFKGINARDSVNLLGKGEAVELVNWIPFPDKLTLRLGSTVHATGFSGAPKCLLPFNSPTTGSNLFAGNASGIFDVTSAGAIGASVATLTNGECSPVNFSTAALNYLYVLNGVDTPKLYNGTTWQSVTDVSAPIAITGVTTSELFAGMSFKTRLHFLRKEYAGFYYIPSGQAGGAATAFPLGQYLTKGGYIVAQNAWTIDGGSGQDDLYVLISSEGEVVIFGGTDPAAPSTWALKGVFQFARPMGKNCLLKQGGDLLILTESGIFPLSKSLLTSNAASISAITDKINRLITSATARLGSSWSWQLYSHLAGPFLIVNTPESYGLQFVVHSQTGAWCKFEGWVSNCFCSFQGTTYMCVGTTVMKAFSGYTDNGVSIYGKAITAFNYFSGSGAVLTSEALRCLFLAAGSFNYGVELLTGFETGVAIVDTQEGISGAAIWDAFDWDEVAWAGESSPTRNWITPPHNPDPEMALALIATSQGDLSWLSTDYLWSSGSALA